MQAADPGHGRRHARRSEPPQGAAVGAEQTSIPHVAEGRPVAFGAPRAVGCTTMDLREISDRLEIAELLARYARALDTKDWTLWRTVFTDDAHIDYRSAGGIAGDRETVANWLAETIGMFPMTQHYVTNLEVELDGDMARVRAMFYNPLRFPGADDLTFCGGWYHHQLVRTADGWRSRDLREESLWFHSPPPRLAGKE